MIKVDIFGSCVTRDVFKYNGGENFKINSYFARSSIVSIYSKPLKVSLDEINLPSAFQKRMVYWDCNKYFPKFIKSTDANFLIIDFIDERIRLLKTNSSIITRSTEFVKSGLNFKGTILSNEEKLELFRSSINKFIEDVKNAYQAENIILHEAYFKSEYINKNKERVKFVDPEIEIQNALLKEYYQALKENIPELKVIKLDKYISDENHEWGLTPFHYEHDYYQDFLNQLTSLTLIK